MRLGVAGRATLLTLAIVCAAFVACSVYLHASQSSALRARMNVSLSNLSAASAQGVGNWLRGKFDLTELMAQQIAATGGGPAADGVLSAPIVERTFYVRYFGTPDGFYARMPKAQIAADFDPRKRPWYKDAVTAGGPILTEPYRSASSGKLVVTAASPAQGRQGALLGVVGGDFEIALLSRMIDEIVGGGVGYAYLVSGAGRILIHPKADLIGKPLSDLLAGPLPTIAAGDAVETLEGDRPTFTVFARVPNLPPSLDWYVAVSADGARAAAPIAQMTWNMATSTVIALLVLALGVGQLMARTVAAPLNRLVGVLQRMSQGEIDAEIVEARRGDEIGMVGRAVEGIKVLVARQARERAEAQRHADEAAAAERRRTMIALADGFETAVGAVVGAVSSSASALQATAQGLTTAATQGAGQSTSAAAAAEQAAANVRTVAAAAEQLGASVQEIAAQVEGSSRLAQAAVGEADRTGQVVQDLAQAVSTIGAAVDLIAGIAAQTNLLALNATIEAARAGEAGRGFAVVAAEVKELANQTARATEEITGLIGRIQGSTGQAAQAISGIVTRIREINDVAAGVAAAVEEQGAATREIVRNVSEAATGTDAVTTNITGVAAAAEQTGGAAHQVLDSASGLARQAEHLTWEVGRFLNTVRVA